MAQRKKATHSKSTKPSDSTAKAPAGKASAQSAQSATPKVVMTLNHEQIAKRAFAIWIAKGRPHGQDTQNWREAEQVLASELARRA